MGLTTALYTSLSGLVTSSQALEVAGNNIANVNTTAFKSSRALFETQISQNILSPAGPSANLGGRNPSQVGLGVRISGIQRDFTGGTLQPTGKNTDVAIEGNGFFILNQSGSTRYTRAGTFSLDRDFNLVAPDGSLVQGFSVDSQFNVVQGVLGKLTIPVGALTLAEPTEEVRFAGNLNAGDNADIATNGSRILSTAMSEQSTGLAATAATLLTDLQRPADDGVSPPVPMFQGGGVIQIRGIQKGGATLPDRTFEINSTNSTGSDAAGTTLGEFATFLDEILGIDSSILGGPPQVTETAGVNITASGELEIIGNTGYLNRIDLTGVNILHDGRPQFTLSKTADATGESATTVFVAFDSLGTPLTMEMTMVLEQKKELGGTVWRFYAQSEADSDIDRVLGNGLIEFDSNGRLVSIEPDTVLIDRENTGAETPQIIRLSFGEASVSALADTNAGSQVSAISQDGSPIGTLEDFSITEDGTIVGVFSNSLLRSLGQLAMAMFANPAGLVDTGGNTYNLTINSGTPQIVTPGSGGSGRMVGGAIEIANVELSEEFITLINASTGYSASSRVLTTSDRLIQELLAVIR